MHHFIKLWKWLWGLCRLWRVDLSRRWGKSFLCGITSGAHNWGRFLWSFLCIFDLVYIRISCVSALNLFVFLLACLPVCLPACLLSCVLACSCVCVCVCAVQFWLVEFSAFFCHSLVLCFLHLLFLFVHCFSWFIDLGWVFFVCLCVRSSVWLLMVVNCFCVVFLLF